MAGDWIAVTTILPRKREVAILAHRTGYTRREVIGLLIEFWAWLDGESEDGFLPGMTVDTLSLLWRHDGDTLATSDVATSSPSCRQGGDVTGAFWSALIEVGWLEAGKDGLTVPNYDRWMGASAKRRLRKNRSKQKGRSRLNSDDDVGRRQSVAKRETPCRQNVAQSRDRVLNPLPPEREEQFTDVHQTLGDVRSGAKEVLACDRPDLFPSAKEVLAHFERVVKSAYPSKAWAVSKVVNLLASGRSAAELKEAAEGYADRCQRGDVPANKRQAAQTFFSPDGSWETFLGWRKQAQEAAPKPKPFVPPQYDPDAGEALRKAAGRDRPL